MKFVASLFVVNKINKLKKIVVKIVYVVELYLY